MIFFWLVGFLPTNYQSACSRKGESTGVGAEDACWPRVLCSCPARTLALRPTMCAFFSYRPGSCAEEQREDGPAGSEQRNRNLYLGQDFGKPGCSFCRLQSCCNLLQAFSTQGVCLLFLLSNSCPLGVYRPDAFSFVLFFVSFPRLSYCPGGKCWNQAHLKERSKGKQDAL